MERGAYLSSEPHAPGTQEFITVFQGELTVRIGNEEFTIGTGDSIRSKADRPHSYHNSGTDMARYCTVIHYQA